MNKRKKQGSQLVRNAKRIIRFLREHKKRISPLLIMTHDFPDPDALGSAVALQHLAKSCFGIRSKIVYGGIIGRTENRGMVQLLKLPVHRIGPSDLARYKHTVLVDTQPPFENNQFPQDRKATLVIDQHPSVDKPDAELAIVDTTCGATSAILARALLLMKSGEIPSRVATSLAYGILSDTLNLYRAPHALVIDTYLDLMPYCDMRTLAKIQNPTRSKRFFRTLGKGIHRAKVRRGLIVAHLGKVENPDLVSQVADFLLTYNKMRYACSTGRYQGKLYVSLRLSKAGLEASRILRDVFGSRGEAGGHGAIAGGSFLVGEDIEEKIWADMENVFTESLVKRLRIPKKSEFTYPFRGKD